MRWRSLSLLLTLWLLVGLAPAWAQPKLPPKTPPRMAPKQAPLPEDFDALIKLLQNPRASQAQRVRVIRRLQRSRSDKAVDALLQATRDPDPVIQGQAARALGRWQNLRAEPRLLELYRDTKEPPTVRSEAIRSLGLIGNPAMAEVLRQALTDPEPQVRKGAIQGLQVKTYRDIADRTDLWLQLLTDEGQDAHTRAEAAEALGRRGDPKAVPALLAVLEKPAAPVLNTSGASDKLKAGLASKLTLQLETQVNVRAKAALALGKIGDRKAVPALATALAKDQDPYVRYMAAQSLGKLGGPEALKALLAAMGDGDSRVRRQVIFSLGHFKEPEVAKALEPLLNDPDPGVRLQAAIGLAKRGNPEPLMAQAEKDEHKAVRGGARETLKSLGLPVPPEKSPESKAEPPKSQ